MCGAAGGGSSTHHRVRNRASVCLSNLALVSIENDRAQKINIDKVINDFASKKVRKQKFM